VTDPAIARLLDRQAIVALNDDFARGLDLHDRAAFLGIFAPDVTYSSGPRSYRSRDELAQFFDARLGGNRLSRHMYSGLTITFTGPDHATGYSVWLTFAGTGPAPVQMADPFQVADITDRYERGTDGWKIASRRIETVFRNPAVAPPPAGTPG
jgi:hypothetical protein